jgi:hypothetical protein
MNTLFEFSAPDGELWSYEEQDGEYFLTHVMCDDIGPRTVVPLPPDIADRLAAAVRR